MIYGEKKIKSIYESILPSTSRKKVRQDKARIARHARRTTTQELHMIWDYESAEDCEEDITECSKKYSNMRSEMVWTRRAADNTAALYRWAERVTQHLDDPEERYNYVRSLMPNSLPGRHALTHLPWTRGYEGNWRDWNSYRGTKARNAAVNKAHNEKVYAAMREGLIKVLGVYGAHRKLNQYIKDNHVKSHTRLIGRDFSEEARETDPNKYFFMGKKLYERYYCEGCKAPTFFEGINNIDQVLGHRLRDHYQERNAVRTWLTENGFMDSNL